MTTSQVAPELIQYSCERCKTRFVLPPSSRRLGIAGTFRGLFMGAGRALKRHQGLRSSVGSVRHELLAKKDDEAYQAFVLSFRFCHECRQFVCNDCWSKSRGTCLTCATKATASPARPRPVVAAASVVAAATPDIPRPIISMAPQRRGRTRRDFGLAGVTLAIVLVSIEGGVLLLNATGGPSDLSPAQMQGTPAPGATPLRQWIVTPAPGTPDNGTPSSTDVPIAIAPETPTPSLPPGVTAPPAPPAPTAPPRQPKQPPPPTPKPGELIVIASGGTMRYGDPVPTITASYLGFTGGDTAASLTTKPTCSTVATSSSTVGTYASSCTGAVDSKYIIIYSPGLVGVTPAPLTVTANGQPKTYGSALDPGTSAFTASGLVNGDTVTSVSLTSTSGLAGSPTTAAGSYANNIVPNAPVFGVGSASNYNITYASGTLTVNKAALTITANNLTKTYGETVAFVGNEFTTGAGQLVNGDTVSSVTLTSAGSAASAAAGTDSISPSAAVFGSGVESNYNITYANGTLTVNKATLTITADPQTIPAANLPFPFAGTEFQAVGLLNTDTVTSASISAPLAIAGAGPGSYQIDISAAVGTGLGNYIITYVSGTLTAT